MVAEARHLSEQIVWYTRNKAEVLAYQQDHLVAELDLIAFTKWEGRPKRDSWEPWTSYANDIKSRGIND